MQATDPFMTQFQGFFSSALQWSDLEHLWQVLEERADASWFVYAVGETPPATPCSKEQFVTFLKEINSLLRRDHDEEYCGIVYADDMQQPGMVKIYDPHNLGSSCGSSGNAPPPLPGWILSRLPPPDMQAMRQTANRQRWWQKLFA